MSNTVHLMGARGTDVRERDRGVPACTKTHVWGGRATVTMDWIKVTCASCKRNHLYDRLRRYATDANLRADACVVYDLVLEHVQPGEEKRVSLRELARRAHPSDRAKQREVQEFLGKVKRDLGGANVRDVRLEVAYLRDIERAVKNWGAEFIAASFAKAPYVLFCAQCGEKRAKLHALASTPEEFAPCRNRFCPFNKLREALRANDRRMDDLEE